MRSLVSVVALAATLAILSAAHAVPLPKPRPFIGPKMQMYCMARAVYCEARGMTLKQKYDVAFMVMNRIKANRPDLGGGDACGVVFKMKPHQFSCIHGKPNDPWQPDKHEVDAWFTSLQVSYAVLTHAKEPQGFMKYAMYFMEPEYSTKENKRWFYRDLRLIGRSGTHLMFAEK